MKKSKLIPIIVYIVIAVIVGAVILTVVSPFGKDKDDTNKVSADVENGDNISGDDETDTQGDNSDDSANNIENETTPKSEKSTTSGSKRNVMYYTSWSAYARGVFVKDIDASLITHINFAFANLNTDGSIAIGDGWVDVEQPMSGESWDGASDSKGHFNALKILKQKYPHLKTLISVGGWTWSGNFSDVAADEGKRQKFADTSAAFVAKYGFDGVDIDWEFPVAGGNNVTTRPEDRENYVKLLKALREALDKQGKADNKTYLLTIVGDPNVRFAKNTDLKGMMKYLDFINVIGYDYHGAWETVTNSHAPLYANPKDPTEFKDFSIDGTITAYIKAGVKPADINLGLPLYGRGWTGVTSSTNNGMWQDAQTPAGAGFGSGTWEAGSFDYVDIVQNYIGKSGYKRYWDDVGKVPYLFNGSSFISYDDEESILLKLKYCDKKNLGGVMCWEFTGDKNKTLQKVIANFYGKSLATGKSTTTTTTDKKETTDKQPTASAKAGDTWKADAEYQNGATVIYQGKTYSANWWNTGETPDPSNQWGAWRLVG